MATLQNLKNNGPRHQVDWEAAHLKAYKTLLPMKGL